MDRLSLGPKQTLLAMNRAACPTRISSRLQLAALSMTTFCPQNALLVLQQKAGLQGLTCCQNSIPDHSSCRCTPASQRQPTHKACKLKTQATRGHGKFSRFMVRRIPGDGSCLFRALAQGHHELDHGAHEPGLQYADVPFSAPRENVSCTLNRHCKSLR